MVFQRLLLLEYGGGPEKDRDVCFCGGTLGTLSRIRLASRMSFRMMVTRLVLMAHKLASSNSLTRYASATSWRHSIAADWNRRSVLKSWVISHTNLWNGNFQMSSAEVFWSGGCLVEPQFPLCTCGASPVYPASWPHVSSSSARQSSPICGVPAWFSLLYERCTALAASCQLGGKLCPSCMVLCEPPLVLVVHFRPSSCAC